MAILTLWDNRSKNAIRFEFESEWTWDELELAIQKADDYISSVEHQVDLIMDIEGTSIPKDIMTAAKKLLDNPEPRPNEGRRVVVGANKAMRAVYKTIQKTFQSKIEGREILFAPNLDDARAILRGLRFEQQEP